MSTDRIAYGTSTAITCTLASKASSSSNGQSCAAIDNTTNLYVDAMLTLKVKVGSGTIANDQCCYVYLYGSEDGTAYTGDTTGTPVGTDASVSIASPTNWKGPYVIACPTAAQTYTLVIGSVASAFGGIMPRKWGFVLQNYTGLALDATEANHQKTYTGITYTDT